MDFKQREEIAPALDDFDNRWCKRKHVELIVTPPFRRKARGHSIRFSVVRGAWYVMRGAWFRVSSRYLVSATPHTVLDRFLQVF